MSRSRSRSRSAGARRTMPDEEFRRLRYQEEADEYRNFRRNTSISIVWSDVWTTENIIIRETHNPEILFFPESQTWSIRMRDVRQQAPMSVRSRSSSPMSLSDSDSSVESVQSVRGSNLPVSRPIGMDGPYIRCGQLVYAFNYMCLLCMSHPAHMVAHLCNFCFANVSRCWVQQDEFMIITHCLSCHRLLNQSEETFCRPCVEYEHASACRLHASDPREARSIVQTSLCGLCARVYPDDLLTCPFCSRE